MPGKKGRGSETINPIVQDWGNARKQDSTEDVRLELAGGAGAAAAGDAANAASTFCDTQRGLDGRPTKVCTVSGIEDGVLPFMSRSLRAGRWIMAGDLIRCVTPPNQPFSRPGNGSLACRHIVPTHVCCVFLYSAPSLCSPQGSCQEPLRLCHGCPQRPLVDHGTRHWRQPVQGTPTPSNAAGVR